MSEKAPRRPLLSAGLVPACGVGGRLARAGLTLMELVVVLVVLIALAAIVIPLVGTSSDTARETTTRASQTQLRDVIMGNYRLDMEKRLPRPGYHGINNAPNRLDKPQVRYLFVNPGPNTSPGTPETADITFDPIARKGWRGPYLLSSTGKYKVNALKGFTRDFGEDDDPAVLDGWNHPIVIVESSDRTHAELRSAGHDGILMTMDDLVLSLY